MLTNAHNNDNRHAGVLHSPGAEKSKAALRRLVLERMGSESCRVLEVFAGAGVMRDAWRGAALVAGIDLVWSASRDDGAERYVGDSYAWLRRLDLGRFNVFDVDAFGSPYRALAIISRRRAWQDGERVAIVVTDGLALHSRKGLVPIEERRLVGLATSESACAKGRDVLSGCKASAIVQREAFTAACERIGVIVARFEATARGSIGTVPMRYSAAVIEARGK